MGQGMVFLLVLVSLMDIGISTDIQVGQLQFMVKKLQETVMSLSKENAKYKKLVDDIVEKLPDFENVENCKRNCKPDSYFYPEVTTNMSEEAQNLGNGHAIVDRMDSKKLTTIEQILQTSRPKRAITSRKLPFYFSKIE